MSLLHVNLQLYMYPFSPPLVIVYIQNTICTFMYMLHKHTTQYPKSRTCSCSLKLFSFHSTVFNPPSITPDTSLLDITEGNSTTLTCTRDSTNTNNDQYRWTLPDGDVSPPQFASSPQLILSTINRDESGVYVCTGTRPGTSKTVNANITINVQCKLVY